MASMSEREHRQAEKQRRPLIISPAERKYDQAKDQAMRAVKFTVIKGWADPDETKEFNATFKRLWNGEITRRQFDEWVTTFNARPRGRQEFKI